MARGLDADFQQALIRCPVIAAARTHEQAARAAASRVEAVFLLGGSILSLADTVLLLHRAKKRVFIHLDLCSGLGKDDAAVEWCAATLQPEGMISTRAPILRRAAELGLMTIQRLFLMDSSSFEHGIRLLRSNKPDMVEVLPALVPKAIQALCQALKVPIIAGGMVTCEEEVENARRAGALAISTSQERLWDMYETQ